MPTLLDKRLIFVTGKGGVGKSTVAIALGLLAARRGLRTIVAELSSQERIAQALDQEHEGYGEIEVAPGLFAISVDPQHAMEEYLKLKVGAAASAVSRCCSSSASRRSRRVCKCCLASWSSVNGGGRRLVGLWQRQR